MNPSKRLGTGLALTCLLGLVGCSKTEPTAPAADPAPNAAAPTAMAAPELPPAPATPAAAVAEVQANVTTTAAATMAAAREALASLKLPDFQTATTQQLSSLATRSLTQWAQAVEATSPAITQGVEAVKTALANEQPTVALASLTKLSEYAKAIPGGDLMLQTSKQLVSAWALKQGFDTAKISGVLGSLQRGDYVGVASQSAAMFAKGGVNTEQKGLLDGVLGTFGLDATQAAGAVNVMKGLFAK